MIVCYRAPDCTVAFLILKKHHGAPRRITVKIPVHSVIFSTFCACKAYKTIIPPVFCNRTEPKRVQTSYLHHFTEPHHGIHDRLLLRAKLPRDIFDLKRHHGAQRRITAKIRVHLWYFWQLRTSTNFVEVFYFEETFSLFQDDVLCPVQETRPQSSQIHQARGPPWLKWFPVVLSQ